MPMTDEREKCGPAEGERYNIVQASAFMRTKVFFQENMNIDSCYVTFFQIYCTLPYYYIDF